MPNEFDVALSHFTPDPKALAEARKKRLKKADSYEQGYREGQQIREEQERAAKLQLQEQERLDKQRAAAEAEQATLERKQRLADTERAYAREGRPTRTDAMGEIFTVDDDETWQRKQAEKKVAEDLKAQSRADAAFRKSEAVRLNQAETKLKAGLNDFDTAEAIGSQAVSAKASEIISLSQAHKAASDDTLAPAQRTQITSTPDYQQWLAGQPPESKDNPFAIGDYLATRIQTARKEKELLENSERTIKVAKLNKEQELKPALGAIQQQRDVLPITTAPAIPKGAGVTLQNTVSTATPTPASADPERAAAVLRTQITVLREKGDFARADALERRLTNPAKWEAEQKAFRQTATPEQLAQTVNAGRADITEQWQATEQVHSVLSAQRQAYYDRLDRAKAKNDALLNQPYSDGDVAVIRDETTGEETRWHKAAAEEYNGALQGLNSWQQANQQKIDLLNLNQQQLQIEAANLKKHENQLRYLGREQQRQQDGENSAKLNALRQIPGMAEFADETERRSAEFKQRQSELERKYAPLAAPAADETTVQEAPEEFARKNESLALKKAAALRALQEEAKASDISMQERMAAKEQNIATLYTDWAKDMNVTDWQSEDSVTPRLQQEAKARGLTEQEARKFLDYARKADWTRPLVGPASRGIMREDIATGIGSGLRALIDGKQPDEPSRNLPNGTLSINPDLHLDKAAYMQAVQDAPSSPQAKKLAREQFTKLHELAGAQAVAGLENEAAIIGLPDFNNWRAEKLQNTPEFARKTLGTQATEFLAEMKQRPATAKYADTLVRKVASGLAQVSAMINGATALATGPIPGVGAFTAEAAGANLKLADMLSGQVGSKGGADTIGLRAGGLLAELVPQLLPMMAGGGLLSAGGKISPMVAASLMGGVQTAGLQQASVYQNIRAQINPATGKPYTHLEAWSRAAPGAIASGIVTGLLTTLGGKTGGEAALAGMMSQAGREAARKALRESYKNVWSTMKTITGHGVGEYLEEAPDELFSQISEEISTKGNSADLGKVIAGWIELQPELMLAVTAMGSGAGTVGDLVNRKANQQALLAEDLAAAEAEIENYEDATLDQTENDHRRNRAMLALAIARGVGIDGIDESILNSAGWTRKNPDGITRADGSLTKIKSYASQNVLDVDSEGRVKLDAAYVKNLGAENGMPALHGIISPKQTAWHKPGQIEEPVSKSPVSGEAVSKSSSISPAPASPAPSAKPSSGEVGPRTPAGTPQTRGTSAQGAAPVAALDTGGKTQAAAPAVSGAAAVPAHAPDSKEAVAALLPTYGEGDPRPQRAWEIANHLEMAGLDRASANLVAASAIRSQGIKGKTVNDQVTSPEFNQLLDDLGATGDRTTREGSAPLALTRAPSPPKVNQPTASQAKASPAPASPAPRAKPSSGEVGPRTPAGTEPLKIPSLDKVKADPQPAPEQPDRLRKDRTPLQGGNVGSNPALATSASPEMQKSARPEYAALRDRLKAKDISTVDAVREVIRLTGETDTGVLQDLLTDHLGLKKPSAAAAVETLRAAGELKGDKNDDISIAAGKRASDRQPKPSDKAYTASKEFVPATQGALAENPAWARAKLSMLARTPPARRRWAYRFLTQLENTISQRAGLYDAFAVGQTARKALEGNKIAVVPIQGKTTLAIDLDRMLADFSYLGDPRAAAVATVMEEDIHAAQFHLMAKGGRWTKTSLAQQWRDLPPALQKTVWQAYNAANPGKAMPKTWSDNTAFQMQSEFLRMLVQGRIDPKSITEAVDASPGLIQSIKDLLADLYDTLRSLIKGLPVSQAVTLDQQVTELKTALEQLGKPSTAEELRTKLFLRDPSAVAMQALKNGTVFDQLATQDALFTPQGLRRVWDLLTPEMRAQVERLKLTAAPWLSKKRTDNAALTRDLLTFLLDPRAAEALAQANLTGSPAATASTGMVRRALKAMSDYFRNNRPDFAQTLSTLDLPTAQVLQQMQSLLVNARAQFEASAAVQKLPTLVIAEPQADDEDAYRREGYRKDLRRTAKDVASAIEELLTERDTLAQQNTSPQARQSLAQRLASLNVPIGWDELKAKMEANIAAGLNRTEPPQNPAQPLLLNSPAQNSARAIAEDAQNKAQSIAEENKRRQQLWELQNNTTYQAREGLLRRLLQEELAAATLAIDAKAERTEKLTPVQQRQIEALLQVAAEDLALDTPYNQRQIGQSPDSGAPVRQMGLSRENALAVLGIRIGNDGTAYAAANAPVYIEGGTILIKQTTLDDLSQTLPITRRQFRLSEDEQRARIGLRGAPQPVTAATVAEARAADQQQQDTSKVTARLEQLEAQERAAEKTSVKPVPLIDPNADPKTGKLHRGERGDLISWLGDHGSLGWPDSQAGGEWDWFLDLLGDYYNPESTGRTRKKALRDSKGNVIGIKDAAVQGTKLGMTNTAKKMARDGNLSTPAAIVEYLIQEGVVTPAIPTEDGSPRNLSLHENIGDRTGIDAIEEAAREANHDVPDGIGNAVMTALDGREAARTNRQNDPERAAELQTLRFERDTRSGPVVVPAHELAPLSDDGPTFITARSQDGDMIPLEVASYEWQPIDPDTAEADDYLEGHPAWRGAEEGNPERLVITLRGGTYYGQQTIPGDTLLRVEDAGNTGIGMDLGDGKGDFVTDEEMETPVETLETENSEPGTENELSTNPTLEAEIYAELRKAGLLASSDRRQPLQRISTAAREAMHDAFLTEAELIDAIAKGDPLAGHKVIHYWNSVGFTEIANGDYPEITRAFIDAVLRIPTTALPGQTIYRYQGYPTAEARAAYLQNYQPGEVITIARPVNAFTNWPTMGKELAESFGGDHQIEFVIESPKAVRDLASIYEDKRPGDEVLYPQGSQFTIKSISRPQAGTNWLGKPSEGTQVTVTLQEAAIPRLSNALFAADRLRPAIRNTDGKIIVGRPGELHFEIARRDWLSTLPAWQKEDLRAAHDRFVDEIEADNVTFEQGYHSDKTGFITGEEAIQYLPDNLQKQAAKLGELNSEMFGNNDGLPISPLAAASRLPVSGAAVSQSPPLSASDRFYSQLARTVEAKMPNRADAKTLRGLLENPQNRVKAEELKWSGLLAWADSQPQPLTKPQVLDFLATEGSVRFEETRLGGDDTRDRRRYIEHAINVNPLVRRAMDDEGMSQLDAANLPGRLLDGRQSVADLPQSLQRYAKDLLADHKRLAELGEEQRPTRNTQWTLPGGENHREVVVTWKQPIQKSKTPVLNVTVKARPEEDDITGAPTGRTEYVATYEGTSVGFGATRTEAIQRGMARAAEIYALNNSAPPPNTPNHPGDTPHYGDLDALAWFRANDRDNGQGLLVEEFQSKWHQQGRDKGYNQNPTIIEGVQDFAPGDTDNYGKPGFRIQLGDGTVTNNWYAQRWQAEEAIRHNPDFSGVPDAPYRSAWPLMLFKRALADAVAEGKQWIGWTTGDTQADRYDLSKQVSTIQWNADTGKLEAYWGGTVVINKSGVTAEQLGELVGKEPAKKLIEGKRNRAGYSEVSGEDLKVGGEGMRKFYDDILVKEFGKYVKPWGGKVEKSEVNSSSKAYFEDPVFDIPSDERDRIAEEAHTDVLAENPGIDDESDDYLMAVQERITDLSHEWVNDHVVKSDTTPIWRIDITPAMRESVAAGQALFASDRSQAIRDGIRRRWKAEYEGESPLEAGAWWIDRSGNILPLVMEHNEIGEDIPDAQHPLEAAFDLGFIRASTDMRMGGDDQDVFYQAAPGHRPTQYQQRALKQIAEHKGGEVIGEDDPRNLFLAAANKIRDLADDTANDAYAAGDRSFYAYLQRMKRLLVMDDGFEAFKPYMRGSWTTIADTHGLPEPTRAAAEADYFRLARQKSPAPGGISQQRPQGPTPRQTPAPAPTPAPTQSTADLEWEMGLSDNPTPEPWSTPPGRRVVPRDDAAEAPGPVADDPEADIEADLEDPNAPKVAELGFEVESHQKDKKKKEKVSKLKEILDNLKARPSTVKNRQRIAAIQERLDRAIEDLIQSRGATLQQREQAIDEIYGPLAPGVTLLNTKTQNGSVVPHIMRGRAIMVEIDSTPHVATRMVALPSVGKGDAEGVRFLPLAGDKSNWTGHINTAIKKAAPNLDAETDIYIEPYGGGLVYLQNLDILRRTKKPVLIAVSQEFEPERFAIYSALARNDQTVIRDLRQILKDPTQAPTTSEGTMFAIKLFGTKAKKKGGAAVKEAFEQLDNLAALLQRPNVKLMHWTDAETFRAAIDRAGGGKRVTLLEDSNYADLFGEETEDQYAKLYERDNMPDLFQEFRPKGEFIGKDPAKLLAQKLIVYRAVLDAGGTIIATNNMNHTLLGGLLAEFGDQGHWFGYAHATRPVKDGWLKHPDGKGVLWSTERPEYLAILRKGVDTGTAKYGHDTSQGLDYRPGVRRSADDNDRAAQPRREPSPYTGGSPESAELLLRQAANLGSPGPAGESVGLRDTGRAETPEAGSSSEPRARTIERTMSPLPEGADMTSLERAQYDRAQAERKAAAYDFTSANDDLDARYAEYDGSPDDDIRLSAAARTPAFDRWFGNSKVTDANGNPKVVYHGTNQDFDAFRSGFAYFSDKASTAHSYAPEGKIRHVFLSLQNPWIINAQGQPWHRVPLMIQPPLPGLSPEVRNGFGSLNTIDELAALAKQRGHDGLIVTNVLDDNGWKNKTPATTYVAFTPTQIKSATRNTGAYSPDNPSILASSDRQPSDLSKLLEAHPDAGELSDIDLTAYRVGALNPFNKERGSFFGDDYQSAQDYANRHPGHVVTAYRVEAKKAFVAKNLHQAWRAVFGKPLDINDIDRRFKFKNTALAWRWADTQLFRKLRGKGYDALILRDPAPPARHEIALIDKSAKATPLASAPRITEPPFSTPESKALEDTRIHAIDTYLHGTRRPIANTPPADQAGSSRTQLQTLLSHLRRGQRTGGSSAGNEQTGRAKDRQRDKALLIDWARNAGVLMNAIPGRYQIDGPKDKGGREHHVFHDSSGRWLKITKGDGDAFGLQPLDEGGKNEWMLSPEPADAASYLEKLILHNQVFHDDIVLHGVVADPLGNVSLIISQPDYKGTYAGVYTAIKPAMEAAGFVRVEPPSARLEDPSAYYRPSDNLAVVDLHDQNAVLEGNGTFLRVFDNIMLRPTGALRATFERLAAKNAKPVLASSQRLPDIQTAVMIDGKPHTSGDDTHYFTTLDYIMRQLPAWQREDRSQALEKADTILTNDWLKQHNVEEGFLVDGKFLTRQETLTHVRKLGLTTPLADNEDRDWFDTTDLYELRALPVSQSPRSVSESILAAAAKTNTSPSKAQIEAENYATGKVTVHGLRLSIENPAGSVRKGTDASGKAWEVTMPHHYGRILGTTGADKDHVDFFLGPDPTSPMAFVVNQKKPGNGHFDEHKVMLGFTNPGTAARGYLDSYSKGWRGYDSIVPMTLPQLKHWLEHGKMGEAVKKAPVVSNDTKPKSTRPATTHTLPDGYQLTGPGLHLLPASIRAHHGTPHDIDPKTGFSTSKIGTGEGAQAYGWGLYFAESMELADKYRRHLTTPALIIGDKEFARREGADAFSEWAANQLPKDWPPYAVSRFKEVLNRFHYDVTSFVAHPDEAADDAKKVFEKFLREAGVSDDILKQAMAALGQVVDIAEAPSPQDTTEGRWYARAIGWRPHRTSSSIETAAYYDMFSRIGWYASTFADAPARIRKEYRQTINAQQHELDRLLDIENRPHTDPAVTDAIKRIDLAEAALQLIDSGKVKLVANPRRGNFYTVDILGDPAEFLNWDADLRDHPAEIRQKFMDALGHVLSYQVVDGRDPEYSRFMTDKTRPWQILDAMGDATGSDAATRKEAEERRQDLNDGWQWQSISDIYKIASAEGDMTPKKASEALAKAGIKGVRYLDGSSRNAGQGTHNYVIFDDKLVKIIERNGQPIDTPALASSNKQPLPAAPDMDDYQTWGKDKATRDSEWKRYRADRAKWEAKVAAFASKQGNLGTFLAPLKSYPSGQAYREARTITRVPGDATRWRATIFGQQPITPTSIPVGDWANNAWVPVAHNEFETKAEAYQSSANAMPEGYTFSTQPLFAANRTTLAAAPRFVEQASRASFNHLDRWFTGAIARQAAKVTSSDPVTAATQAAAAWWNQDTPGVSTLRSLKELAQRELLPETVLPREIMSAMREMQIKQSMGQQKALDVGRALSDKPKFSDLHYPPEFVENPMHREAMFSAMEQGKVDTLPPALQAVAKKLRQMLVEAGREAVRQGRMNPDTFEGLRTNFMPRFTKEEAQASAGDFAKRFKLGVKDILAQRSTAFHITDTSRKDKNGLPQIVSHARGKWRFDSQQARDAYYEDLINRQTLDGDLAKNDMHWMNRGDARALRSITPEMLKAPATMTKDQRDVVARVQRQLRNQFKKEDPYEPKDLVKDPVYAVMRYLAQMTHDNAVAEFFNVIDTNPDWTSTTEMKGFTQIPDNDRFGALAGKYVRKDIADQVMELAHTPAQVIQLYDTLLRLWKTGKTVLNPATHARNIIGNLPFAQFAGNNALNPANWTHYAHAMRTLREGGDEYRQLYETGVLGADYASTELRAALENIVPVVQEDDSTNPIRHLIALGNRAAQWGKAHSLANVATLSTVGATAGFIAAGPLGALAGAGIAAAANPIYRGALMAYRLEDDLFKAAAFFKARSMGMNKEQAAQHVRDWFPYYDKPTSTTLKFAGRTTMPFLSFFRESARIGAKAAKERPLSLAATLAIPTIITALSQAALGLDDDDMEDVKAGMRGKGAKLLGMTPLAGVPIFSMLIPWRTDSGQLQQVDLSSTHPMADFLANRVENWNNDPWWQAWSRSALANPMLGALYTAATGRDPFGDRTLWDSSYTADEKAKAILGHAWKTAMPPLAPGGTNWTMLEQSTRRQANKTLALRSPAQAVGRGVFGVDVRNADPDIYSLADAFRKRRGFPVTEGNTAYPTDAAGRARKALFEELVQPQPSPQALAKQLQALNDLGKPVRTVADVLDILDYRRPDGVINPKELRVPFRASLAPEARRVLDTALKEFQRARAATPGAFAKARQQIKPTTRAPITEP